MTTKHADIYRFYIIDLISEEQWKYRARIGKYVFGRLENFRTIETPILSH
jgi:hypothetical protein